MMLLTLEPKSGAAFAPKQHALSARRQSASEAGSRTADSDVARWQRVGTSPPRTTLLVSGPERFGVATIRFCAYQYQHLPFDQLFERWKRAEELGFDVLWNVDTVVEPDRLTRPCLTGPPRSRRWPFRHRRSGSGRL
jgi:hypothetical protein